MMMLGGASGQEDKALETQVPLILLLLSLFFSKEMEKTTEHKLKDFVLFYINSILFLS